MKQEKKKTEKNQLDAREDKLALMVQRGFLEVNKNIGQVKEEIINYVKEEIGSVREEVGDLSERVERVEGQLSDVLNNQDKIIKDLEDLKEENAMDIVIHGRMEKRITHLEKDMARIKAKVKV